MLETKEVEIKTAIKHPIIVKFCELIQYYSFNNIIIKVCFDTKETKSLIHQKYSHLLIDHGNIYDVDYMIFNSDNVLFILKNNQVVGAWDSDQFDFSLLFYHNSVIILLIFIHL